MAWTNLLALLEYWSTILVLPYLYCMYTARTNELVGRTNFFCRVWVHVRSWKATGRCSCCCFCTVCHLLCSSSASSSAAKRRFGLPGTVAVEKPDSWPFATATYVSTRPREASSSSLPSSPLADTGDPRQHALNNITMHVTVLRRPWVTSPWEGGSKLLV